MAVLLLASALCLGTGEIERGQVAFRPGPEESSVPARFRLEPAEFTYELEPVLETPRYTVSRLRFPSPVTTADPENNVVHAEYFCPVGPRPKGPGVIVLHILGADFPLSRYLAARLADRGVAALFVKLPYYGERRPAAGGLNSRRFLSADIERTVTAMRQGVCDVRRAATWLADRPDVDAKRLGVTGISLGGIVSSIVVAIDPSIREGAFLLAGGDLSQILWQMPEGKAFRALWIESGRTQADLKALTDPFDPLAFAPRLKGKRVFMMAGKVDEVVPPDCARALWEAAGRPPICWYDCGHYSAVGFLLPGIRRTVDFFANPEDRPLTPEPDAPPRTAR
jgi:dienelactone hydrolase